MINIRPHHLWCIHAFEGKGYDDEFTSNMTKIVEAIKNNEDVELNVVFDTDDICLMCPHKAAENLCVTQEIVSRLDHDVIEVLNLEEKVYSHKEILGRIKSNLNEATIDRICSGCEWYIPCNCKERLLQLME